MKFSLTLLGLRSRRHGQHESEVMLSLWDAFKRENIRVPYPVREIPRPRGVHCRGERRGGVGLEADARGLAARSPDSRFSERASLKQQAGAPAYWRHCRFGA